MSSTLSNRRNCNRSAALAFATEISTQPVDPNVAAAETTLQRVLGTKVRIGGNGNKGRVEIHYHSADELDRVYQLIVEAGKKRSV